MQWGRTAVWLHPAALLVAGYMVFTGYGMLMAVGMASILLHESAHALCSTCFGHPPEDVELTPLGALMRLDDDGALPPAQRLLVLLAGPAMTLLLCYLALLMTRSGALPFALGRQLFLCNAAMLTVNLLPALPLDGGRLMSWLLEALMPRETARAVMRAVGTGLGLLCVGLNLALSLRGGGWNLSLAAAGCFLMYSAARSTETGVMAALRDFMDRKSLLESRGAAPCRIVAVTGDTTLHAAVRCLRPRRITVFCLGDRLLSEQRIMAAYLDDSSRTVGEIVIDRRA